MYQQYKSNLAQFAFGERKAKTPNVLKFGINILSPPCLLQLHHPPCYRASFRGKKGLACGLWCLWPERGFQPVFLPLMKNQMVINETSLKKGEPGRQASHPCAVPHTFRRALRRTNLPASTPHCFSLQGRAAKCPRFSA